MPLAPIHGLVCPHDGERLAQRGNSLVCPRGHGFDVAKEGYVNLLPVQEKASKDPGDSKEMVAARRRFLETGGYAPIAQAVGETVRELRAAVSTTDGSRSTGLGRPLPREDGDKGSAARRFAILDAGCGEGYYLQTLAMALQADSSEQAVSLGGIDISKWAVRAAAKRALPATWVVASNKRPPFPPDSVDLVLCLFGFPVWSGFAAVQPPDGHVLMVDPGPDHLVEMRRIIYAAVNENEIKPMSAGAGYAPVSERRVRAAAHVASKAAIADLLTMTPHDHRASVAGRTLLAERSHLDVTIDVVLRVFRRNAT